MLNMQDIIRKKLESIGLAEPEGLAAAQSVTPIMPVLPPAEIPVRDPARFNISQEQLDIASSLGQGAPMVVPPTNGLQAPVVTPPTVPSVPVSVLTPSERIAAKLGEIHNKDYSKGLYLDKNGNETDDPQTDGIANEVIKAPGKDRKKKWSTMEKFGNALLGFAQGGIPGAITGATDRNYFKKFKDALKTQQLVSQIAAQQKIDDFNSDEAYKQVLTDNAALKPQFEQQKIDLKEVEIKNRHQKDINSYKRLVKMEEGRNARSSNKTVIKEVDGYLFRAYPNDPTKELEPINDPRTGKQAFNPANVAQEIEFADGTKAWAKGGQIVAGKFAGERQASQQAFTANQSQIRRQMELAVKQYDNAVKDKNLALQDEAKTRLLILKQQLEAEEDQ